MIRFACPRCKERLNAPEDKAGTTVACPACREPMQVPPPPTTGRIPEWLDGQLPDPEPKVRDELEEVPEQSVVKQNRMLRRQSFGDAVKRTTSHLHAAMSLVWRHPFRLSFLAIVFVLISCLALGSLVGAMLFPVFAMGYITCIQATVKKEKIGLEGFISFMRHGWDSLWHMVMMLAAFMVTIAAMAAPIVIVFLLLYVGIGTLGAAAGEIGSHSSSTAASSVSQGRMPTIISNSFGVGLSLATVSAPVVVVTPLAAAMILFFYLVLRVSQEGRNPDRPFDLVFNAFSEMLVIGRTRWKELLASGFSVSICLFGLVSGPILVAALLSAIRLNVLAIWAVVGLIPAGLCLFTIYTSVFMTMTCLSFDQKRGSGRSS